MSKIALKFSSETTRLISLMIWEVFKSGLFGFSLFFTVLIFTKYLGFLIGTQQTFSMNMDDVLLSSIGFLLMALIKLLEEIKSRSNLK